MKCLQIFLLLVSSLLIHATFAACRDSKSAQVRSPAVAGRFYPSDPEKLKQAIGQYLDESPVVKVENPIAILVPHAGYVYAGQIYADAYRQVMGGNYDVIVILGVNHTTAGFRGVSLSDYTHFSTPLGNVTVDQEIVAELLAHCQDCNRERKVHTDEHSIEVQLPFLQVLFPRAKIVPAIIHPPDLKTCTRFGQALAKALQRRHALIVISSDLSHYPDSETAARVDRETMEAIATLEPSTVASMMRKLNFPNLDTRACGEAAILAGIIAAKDLGAKAAVTVSYTNSGENPLGERSRAVGYGAMVLARRALQSDTMKLNSTQSGAKATALQESEKKLLLKIARDAIRRYLTTETVPLIRNLPARLDVPQGAFVTLKKNGNLRGCIGHIPPDFALGKTVAAMAIYAAFEDSRFLPVQRNELKDIEIEISVLTPLRAVGAPEEIVVGRDGVYLVKNGKSAVFLPQVATENNWSRVKLLDNLCVKASLPKSCWKSDAKLHVFQAEVFNESELKLRQP